jgi:hypothetical protein
MALHDARGATPLGGAGDVDPGDPLEEADGHGLEEAEIEETVRKK